MAQIDFWKSTQSSVKTILLKSKKVPIIMDELTIHLIDLLDREDVGGA